MIRLQDYTPDVYYRHSRDFQFIGRLYDIVLNSVKTNTDIIYSLPISDNSSTDLLDLMAMTFGFKARHTYNLQQLKSICSAFAKIIRNKGNIQAIEEACNAVMSAEGINEEIQLYYTDETKLLEIIIPQELSDVSLLNDILYYILPAGCGCRIIRALRITNTDSTTITKVTDNISHNENYESDTSTIIDSVSGATIINNLSINNILNYNVAMNSAIVDSYQPNDNEYNAEQQTTESTDNTADNTNTESDTAIDEDKTE